MQKTAQWTDRDVEAIIGNLLRLACSGSGSGSGGRSVYLVHHGWERADYRVFHGSTLDLTEIHGIFGEALDFEGVASSSSGLLTC